MKASSKIFTFTIAVIFGAIFGLLAFKLKLSDYESSVRYSTDLKDVPSLDDARKTVEVVPSTDKYNIVHIVNTWCRTCIQHIPEIKEISNTYPVTGLIWSNDLNEAKNWLNKYGNPYSEVGLLVDVDAISLGVHKTPLTLVIDKTGLVKCSISGSLSLSRFEEAVVPCIG